MVFLLVVHWVDPDCLHASASQVRIDAAIRDAECRITFVMIAPLNGSQQAEGGAWASKAWN
jgi:hypothetical protein